MQFSTKSTALPTTATSCLVLGVFEKGDLPEASQDIDQAANNALGKVIKAGDISGKAGQYLLLHDLPGVKAKRVLMVGLGKKSALDLKKYQKALDCAATALKKYSLGDAHIALTDLTLKDADMARKAELASRVLVNAVYQYNETKSKRKPSAKLKSASVYVREAGERSAAKKGLDTGQAVANGMNLAREMGNLPGNICTPSYLGEQAQALAKKYSQLKTTLLTEAQMKRLGMGALLSVAAGSAQPPAFIVMEYKGAKAAGKPNIIVGKGITFDTGGISLKPGPAMDEMKFDMCGAASVLGTMQALCELKATKNVIGVIASAENMPGGKATKPGDVVTSMSGQTIEILNTDAEGRLVLCDALTYVERYKPKSVVDIATLTGACIVALGNDVSGLMSNDDELADKLYQSGQAALDPCWRMPIWDEYQEGLRSNFADMANIGGKAGAITAACFLSRYAKKYKWAHLDIAGTAWLQGSNKGATGRPVPLLLDYLLKN